MNEARVYRQTTSTTTLTMTTQSPSLEKVRLNGNGEQITLSPPSTGLFLLHKVTNHHPTPQRHPAPFSSFSWAVVLRFVINQLMISNIADLLTILWWPTDNGMCLVGEEEGAMSSSCVAWA